MNRFNDRIASLSDGKKQLLKLRLANKEALAESVVSFAQRRLWFVDQLEPRSSQYNIPMNVRLSGTLHEDAVQKGFDEIVRRHEVLRTTFAARDGEPTQVIHKAAQVTINRIDLSNLQERARQKDVQRLIREHAEAPFDLTEGPLIRVALLRLGDRENILLVTMHHAISDAWSGGILIHEFSTLYGAYVAGRPSPLPELNIQYRHYANWQRKWLEGKVLAEQLDYWRNVLADISVLELPCDYARPALPSHLGAREKFRINGLLRLRLLKLSQDQGVTLFMLMLTVLYVVLGRCSGQTDLAVGVDVANRNRVETEGLIGFFVNQLVVRVSTGGNPSFIALLQKVKEATVGAYAHQDLPFEKLVESIAPERIANRTPLFQVKLAVQNGSREHLVLPELRVELSGDAIPVAKYDLTLTIVDSGSEIHGNLVYARDLYSAETAAQFIDRFRAILSAVAEKPEMRIASLPILAVAERRRLLEEWNKTDIDPADQKCVHELFSDHAIRRPEVIAVVVDGHHLSYGELERRSNKLSRYLRSLQIAPETRVGLCIERCAETVIGLLGILKAGGAYVPLDPEMPPDRLAFMIEDVQPQLLLTLLRFLEVLPDRCIPVVLLDAQWDQIARESDAPMPFDARLNNLMYITYTSGSAGKPKGVAIQHSGVRRLVIESTYADITTEERLLQFAPLVFDASTFEIWSSFAKGACLVIAPPRILIGDLCALIEEECITIAWLTSALFQHVTERYLRHLYGVRHILTGGEALSLSHIELAVSRLSATTITNGYGPTEGTTFTCCFKITADCHLAGSVPIGRPIANTQVYVLDEAGGAVPAGVPGELYIGGAGLARGYLNRAAMTAERFVPNPYSREESGGRLYRTGDRVRWRQDGNLEFLGRIDQQVKIRGYRIEPGEIEAVLSEQGGVKQSAVVVREEDGEKRLVAYVVSGEGGPTANQLRRGLQEKLPEYMVPGRYVFLERLPLTPNGKLDRKALPEPERIESESRFVAPRTVVEEIIAGIWAEVLRQERIGIEDNFFELGGHSLVATQVVSRIRQALEVDLPLWDLFETPTVAGVAEAVEQMRREGPAVQVPAMVKASRGDGDLPLSFAQQRLWFIDQLEPGSATYNIPAAVRLGGELDIRALRGSVDEIVRRHEVLRTRFESRNGEPVQVIGAAEAVRVPVVDLSGCEGKRELADWLGSEEAGRGFDLSRGPLLRVTLLRMDEREHVLLATMHHIVSDGWSRGILEREFGALYEALREGGSSPLPALELQYADFAVWQRSWLQGEVLEKQLSYWRRQLAGVSPLEIPTDYPRPAIASHRGAMVRFALTEELTRQWRELSRREGVTVFMSLLAAFQLLLSRYTGQKDFTIGTDVANRNRVETEGVIGFFVNQLVLRSQLEAGWTVRELMERVRRVTLEAYQHQDVPFERVVEELAEGRDLSRSPLFQVKLILQNAVEEEVQLKGVDAVASGAGGHRAAKFDMTAVMVDGKRLGGGLEYATDLYEAATMERLLGHLQVVLQSIVSNVERPLRDISLLSEAERRQVTEEWNDTERDYGEHRCIHELVTEQAERSPDAVAVAYEEQQLSYGELNGRANQLAHYLRSLGVGADVRVGLCVERSLEMVVGLLGVLKAGGAYVPLDPEYPAERLAYMLNDAQTPVLLTQQKLGGQLPTHWGQTVFLDREWAQIAQWSTENPVNETLAGHLAYVIYTSGSTGRPKGVAVTHGGLQHYVMAIGERVGMSGGRFGLLSTIAADLGNTVLYPSLTTGGTLELVNPSIPVLMNVDWVKLTPSHLSMVLDSNDTLELPQKGLVLGGEILRWEWIKKVKAAPGTREIWNHYGPTESTVGVATYVLPEQQEKTSASVPIGRPIANTQVYVLDEAGGAVPAGVPGELYIGGAGLARGYLNRAAMTAERFVPNPYSREESGGRLYRTGDRVRWRQDGNLEFLGRIDQQVKIRGYRIEPGEIEAVLSEQGGVKQSAVVVREEDGEKRLVAYVVSGEGGPTANQLRRGLQEKLPEYMVPGRYVFLERLPLTPNGKLDRKALPEPERIDIVSSSLLPRDSTELTLRHVWESVLSVSPIGITENFFQLGGHSLKAAALATRIADIYRRPFPLRVVFEQPTIVTMAEYLRQNVALAPSSPIIPIQTLGTQPPIFCVHPILGSPHCYVALSRHLGNDQPLYGIQSRGLEPTEASLSTVEEMAEWYISAITEVQSRGPYRLVGWSFGGLIAYEIARQLSTIGQRVSFLALLDAYPHQKGTDLPEREQERLEIEQIQIVTFARQLLNIPVAEMNDMSPQEQRLIFLERAKSAGIIPQDITLQQFARFMNIFSSNMLAGARYFPKPYPGSMLLVKSTKMQYGGVWDGLAQNGVKVSEIDAPHHEFMIEPNVAPLAGLLARALEDVTA